MSHHGPYVDAPVLKKAELFSYYVGNGPKNACGEESESRKRWNFNDLHIENNTLVHHGYAWNDQ